VHAHAQPGIGSEVTRTQVLCCSCLLYGFYQPDGSYSYASF